jgi:chromosomal replication initiator protein
MVADIEQPDLEHRIAILKNKAVLDHLELTIPEDVIEFIAENVRSSVRELEGSVIRLLAYASLKHREITIEVAREALREKLRNPAVGGPGNEGGLSVPVIQQAVAKEWGVTADGLRSKVRTKTLTVPRQAAMYLARELLGLQLVEIGAAFGGRDHSTVIHSLERVRESLAQDPEFSSKVQAVQRSLQPLYS